MAVADEPEVDEGCKGRFFGRRFTQQALQTLCCFSFTPLHELYVRSSAVDLAKAPRVLAMLWEYSCS